MKESCSLNLNLMMIDNLEKECCKLRLMVMLSNNPKNFKHEKIIVPLRGRTYTFSASELKDELEKLIV